MAESVKNLQKEIERRLCKEVVLNLQLLIIKIGEIRRFAEKILDNKNKILEKVNCYMCTYSEHFEKAFTEIYDSMNKFIPKKRLSKDYSLSNMYVKEINSILKSRYEFTEALFSENRFYLFEEFKETLDFKIDELELFLDVRYYDDEHLEYIIKFCRELKGTVKFIEDGYAEREKEGTIYGRY